MTFWESLAWAFLLVLALIGWLDSRHRARRFNQTLADKEGWPPIPKPIPPPSKPPPVPVRK